MPFCVFMLNYNIVVTRLDWFVDWAFFRLFTHSLLSVLNSQVKIFGFFVNFLLRYGIWLLKIHLGLILRRILIKFYHIMKFLGQRLLKSEHGTLRRTLYFRLFRRRFFWNTFLILKPKIQIIWDFFHDSLLLLLC